MKGLFIPEITAEMFRNGCLEAIEDLMAAGEIYDVDIPYIKPRQRTGRWVPMGYDGYADGNPVYDYWECSECGHEHNGDDKTLTEYCSNCGARMEVDGNDDVG